MGERAKDEINVPIALSAFRNKWERERVGFLYVRERERVGFLYVRERERDGARGSLCTGEMGRG